MAAAPSYASIPLPPDIIQVSAANTNRDGSGVVVALAAGTVGGIVTEQIRVTAVGATTVGMVRFFLSKDGGSTKRLIAECPISTITPGVSQAAFSKIVDDLTGLTLQDAQTVLYVSTHNAETFNVFHHKAGL